MIDTKAVIIFVSLLVGCFLFYQLRLLALLFFLSLILMTALNPAVTKFCRRGLSRTLSAIVVIALVAVVVIALLALLLPPFIIETVNFIVWIRSSEWFSSNSYLQLVQPSTTPAFENLSLSFGELSSLLTTLQTPFAGLFSFATSAFGNIMLFISLFVMTFYLLIDRPLLSQKARWFTRNDKAIEHFELFIEYWERQVGGWIRGELILMLIIGLLTYAVLAVLQVPYALPLAILAGLLEIVPNLGPTIAAIPAVMISFIFQGPVVGTVVLVATVVVQQIENNIIVPRVMKVSANVNPLIVLLAILAGAELMGIFGALLAVPIYLSIRAWYSFYIFKPEENKKMGHIASEVDHSH